MNIYRLGSSHIVWILQPDDDTDWRDFDTLDGTRREGDWNPLGVKFVSDQLHPSGPYPDVSVIGHVPVWSPSAIDQFAGLLSETVEPLPLQCAEVELSALNVPIIDGALDVDASEVARFSSGRIMRVKQFAFHADEVASQPIFRIPELSSQVFVNQDFVAKAIECGLNGFSAKCVWSSEPAGGSLVPAVPAVPDVGQPLSIEAIGLLDSQVLDEHLWHRVCGLAGGGTGADVLAIPTSARAFYATRLFEWEVGNGGLHQFFFNYPDPEIIEAVAEGYEVFGAPDDAEVIRELVAPFAARESEWRESLRDGRIETFFGSYPQSQLDQFLDRVGRHDVERLAYVRANPERFVI